MKIRPYRTVCPESDGCDDMFSAAVGDQEPMAFRVNFSGLDAGNFLLEFASMVDSDSPENPRLCARIGDANATEGDLTGADDATVTALHVDIDGVNGIALMCLIGQPEGVCVGFTGEPDFKMAIKSQQ